jgi:dTDP-4-amino-4,6-dideoxygalactose transaminase
MLWRLPLADLDIGAEELDAVAAVLKSKWLTMGEVTERFERAFARYLGVRHAFAVSSATAALHLAHVALGIGVGDEVIVPSLTFVATANAVKYTGATPVFADVTSMDDLSISPASIEAAITPATKAIIVMHYGGYLCDMPAITGIARRHGLTLVEDAAHAPGSRLDGRAAGTFGEAGCFSFFSNKNLATGEGGMLVTDQDDIAERVRLLRSHGMTTLTADRHRGHAHSYDVVALGYNYRLDEMRSALGLVQLAKLETNNGRRRAITSHYRALLGGFGALTIPYRGHRGISAAHLLPAILQEGIDRGRFMDVMRARGIQTSIHYPPIHRFTLYRAHNRPASLPLTDAIGAREVTLPLYPRMTAEDVELMSEAVGEALAAAQVRLRA